MWAVPFVPGLSWGSHPSRPPRSRRSTDHPVFVPGRSLVCHLPYPPPRSGSPVSVPAPRSDRRCGPYWRSRHTPTRSIPPASPLTTRLTIGLILEFETPRAVGTPHVGNDPSPSPRHLNPCPTPTSGEPGGAWFGRAKVQTAGGVSSLLWSRAPVRRLVGGGLVGVGSPGLRG